METECYCAALRLAARKVTAAYDAALAPLDINVAQFSLMRKIERQGRVSLTELALLTGLERSTIGRNARVLQRLGLIEDAPSDDERESCLALADAGRRTLRQAMPRWTRAQQKIEASLGRDGAGRLRQVLLDL